MWKDGLISRETAINELKRRGQLTPEITAELENQKIAAEPPKPVATAPVVAPPQGQDPGQQAA